VAKSLRLKVFLIGRVAAEANGRVLSEARFPGRQGRLLFAYLVAARSRPVPRDELADAIWGESPPATWEKALTVIASKLRGLVASAATLRRCAKRLRIRRGWVWRRSSTTTRV
jgi:DNA-binding SARP family transcriptional activator